MKYNYYCPDRRCIKWRCPVIAGNDERCDVCDSCSKSNYDRVVYTKPSDDLRLFTRVPRGSDEWKRLFKQCTAAEQINNCILNHYIIAATRMRSKKRIAFFSTIAALMFTLTLGVSVHLKFILLGAEFSRLLNINTVIIT